jgi:hypothetical protein
LKIGELYRQDAKSGQGRREREEGGIEPPRRQVRQGKGKRRKREEREIKKKKSQILNLKILNPSFANGLTYTNPETI